jgi:hypothetical protein
MIYRLIATTVLLAAPALATAQILQPLPPPPVPTLTTIVDGAGNIVIGNTLVSPDEEATKEELPGLGHKFELLGVMMRDTDPENSAGNSGGSGGGVGGNETISAVTTPTTLAFAYRNLPPGIKITALTNQIGLKYYFVAPRTCHGGSPRIVLFVDAEGDGLVDFAANGHVSPLTNYSACPTNIWITEDLTDVRPRWEVTGASVPGIVPNVYMPWKAFAAAIVAALPNHKVRAGFLLDGESCSFSALGCGKAYYDLVTLENRTLEIWQDTVKK